MEESTNKSRLIMSARKAGVPLLTIILMIMMVVFGIQEAARTINHMSRQAALSSQLYEDSVLAAAQYDVLEQGDDDDTSSSTDESLLPVETYIPIDPQVERRIAFVRMGNSGGTTVAQAFPRASCRHSKRHIASPSVLRECLNKNVREDSPLSSQLEMEMSEGSTPADLRGFTTLLFSVRNPLTRIISSYSFFHHDTTDKQFSIRGHALKDNFYKVCFPTLSKFFGTLQYMSNPEMAVADRGKEKAEIPVEHSEYCQQLLLAVLKGKNPLVQKINAHMRFNVQYYYEETIQKHPEKEILVLRMEHLWDDIKELDVAMGGAGVFTDDGYKTNPFPRTKEAPTPEQFRDLCCIMWEEIERYQELVNLARNLEYPSKLEAIQEVWDVCGMSSRELTTYKTEDSRTEISNQIARSKNGEVVLFSWSQWHQHKCVRTHWEHHRFDITSEPPK